MAALFVGPLVVRFLISRFPLWPIRGISDYNREQGLQLFA